MIGIKDRNDLLDAIDHYGHWGSPEEVERIARQIADNEKLRQLWQRAAHLLRHLAPSDSG